MLEHLPIACVDIVIAVQGSVLLIKRKTPPVQDQWWLPGGRILKGETRLEAARRKALTEVGLDCQVGALIHTAETLFPDGPNGMVVHTINSCFLGYPSNSQVLPQLDQHHHAWQWVDRIPPGLHPYITDCLIAAGLSREPGS